VDGLGHANSLSTETTEVRPCTASALTFRGGAVALQEGALLSAQRHHYFHHSQAHPQFREALGRMHQAACEEKDKMHALAHHLREHGLVPQRQDEDKQASESEDEDLNRNCVIAMLSRCRQ